jgi:hypothetical protein
MKNISLTTLTIVLATSAFAIVRPTVAISVPNLSNRDGQLLSSWGNPQKDILMPTHPSKVSEDILMPTHPPKVNEDILMPTHPSKVSEDILMPTHPSKVNEDILMPTHPSA